MTRRYRRQEGKTKSYIEEFAKLERNTTEIKWEH